MEIIFLGSRFIFYLSLFLLLTGLWRPSVVLWWMSHQNRLKVLKYYGTLTLLSGLTWWVASSA